VTPAARHDSPLPAPVARRIHEVEQRLAGRQRLTGVHAAAVGRNLRQGLSSPFTLLIAAATGFALGQLSKRNRAAARADGDPPRPRRSIVAALMDALTLATTVMTMLPALRRKPHRESATAGTAP
jgi:hypothetical protein